MGTSLQQPGVAVATFLNSQAQKLAHSLGGRMDFLWQLGQASTLCQDPSSSLHYPFIMRWQTGSQPSAGPQNWQAQLRFGRGSEQVVSRETCPFCGLSG